MLPVAAVQHWIRYRRRNSNQIAIARSLSIAAKMISTSPLSQLHKQSRLDSRLLSFSPGRSGESSACNVRSQLLDQLRGFHRHYHACGIVNGAGAQYQESRSPGTDRHLFRMLAAFRIADHVKRFHVGPLLCPPAPCACGHALAVRDMPLCQHLRA